MLEIELITGSLKVKPCNNLETLISYGSRINKNGVLLIASPYTWLEEYTPKAEWLGGQAQQTLDTLRDLLSPAFTLDGEWNLPFLIREHARKYQWSIAQATRWVRQ